MVENNLQGQKTEKIDAKKKIVNIVAIVICVLLLPILIINCTLIVKGLGNPDEVPSIFNRIPLIVLTDSMEPDIKSGDLIICKKIDAKSVKVGDVISFYDPEGTGTSIVTHKVNSIIVDQVSGEIYFRTQGVNNNVEDRLSVPQENLVGIWTGSRFGGMGSVVLFMQSTVGLLICILVPLALIFLAYFINKKKAEKQGLSEKELLVAELNALKAENQALQKADSDAKEKNEGE